MGRMPRCIALIFLFVSLAACSLPRGAALVNEVVKEKDTDTPSFQVVEVTREALPDLAKWPRTGWKGHYQWLEQTRGSNANVIRPGDIVDLVIWDSSDNSLLLGTGEKSVEMPGMNISPSGTLFVPYLGEVVVSGMSTATARRTVQKRLSEIAPSVQVQLTLQPGQNNSVDLVTGVPNPGSFPLANRNVSILSLISQGGGIDKSLRNPLVRLVRGSKTYDIRADDLFSDSSKNVILRGGDKVIVREDERYFTALGATGSEQLIYFDRDRITTMEGLSMLGGLNDNRANLKAVLILRQYPAKRVAPGPQSPDMQDVVFTFNLTNADGLFAARSFEIQPGDTVMATESPVNSARVVLGLIGSAFGVANRIEN